VPIENSSLYKIAHSDSDAKLSSCCAAICDGFNTMRGGRPDCGTSVSGVIFPAEKEPGRTGAPLLGQALPEHGEIIDLVYYHGKSVREVAEIVGVAAATVKTRMFYARKKLAELLEAA
jgi:hypothetical protein